MLRTLALVPLLLALPVEAHALVMCAPKRPTGTVREGAPIKLRTACTSNELQLDPVALGLRGPAGPPGPPGGGAVARDANDARIGFVFDDEQVDSKAAKVVVGTAVIGGVSKPIVAPIRDGGFFAGYSVSFGAPGCTGSAFLRNSGAFDLDRTPTVRGEPLGGPLTILTGGVPNLAGPGTTLYYASGPLAVVVEASYGFATPTASLCAAYTGGAGVFTPPSTCCADTTGITDEMYPASSLDVSVFVPPFRIDTP